MKCCLLLCTLLVGGLILPVLTNGQTDAPVQEQVKYPSLTSWQPANEGTTIKSNVPLNEIKIQAFRFFRRHFPTASDETWNKSPEGLTAYFNDRNAFCKAFFNGRGVFLYCLKYYPGEGLTADVQTGIRKAFPGYGIGLVTEVDNGDRTVLVVRLENTYFIKTLIIRDGKMEVSEELTNGRAPSETASWAALLNY
jgi:hypothetical protein